MKHSVLYIVNPISGKSGKKKRIVRQLRKNGCKLYFTRFAGDAVEVARNAPEEVVVAVGGDGTVNEVARGIAGTGKTMGIIPCGSGDGLARHLHIGGSVKNMLSIIENGKTASLNWGTINGKAFFSVCGTGLDAIVSERFAKAGSRGPWTYVREAFSTWKNFKPLKYTLTIDGETVETEAVLITCGNSCQWGNGAKITPGARSDDGLLDITILKMFHSIEIPGLVWRLMTGTIDKSRRTVCLRGREIDIRSREEGPVHYDGDWMESGNEIQVRLMPSSLKILVP